MFRQSLALSLLCLAALTIAACSDDIPGLGDPVADPVVGILPPPINLEWASNSEWILFMEVGKIQLIKGDGSNEREIISGQGGYDHPTWSPNGQFIAYDHAPDLAATDLWVTEPFSGRTPIRLTEHVRSDERPTWSPDSQQIAFQTFRNGNRDIWLVDANGYRSPVPFTAGASQDEQPAWSPNGDEIAFISNRAGSNTIWIQPVDGDDNTARQLTDNPEADALPIWSPDGSQIAYVSKRSGNWYLWVVDVASGTSRQVSVTDGIYYPNWSYDGQFLVFQSNSGGWMVRADGQGRQIQIVEGLSPTWAPDSHQIAYVRWNGTRYEIPIQEQTTDLNWVGEEAQ